jgi:hypothetical protein
LLTFLEGKRLMNPAFRQARTFAIAASVALTLAAGTATAQETATDVDCTLARLAVPLWDGTPAAEIAASPVATPTAANAQIDEADIVTAVAVIVACMNTGEPQLMFAIYTDRFLAAQYADPTTTYLPEFEQRLAENAPEPANQFVLREVSEITPLDDGRVSVKVTLSSGATTFDDTLVLANQEGVWLIDDIASLDPAV